MKTKIQNTGIGLLVSAMEIKAMVLGLLASAAFAASGGMLVKNGDRIVFMGDSITHYGVERSHGYVRLTVQGLAANGIEVDWIGRGVPGEKASQMRARFQHDVVESHPAVVTISAGVNDVALSDQTPTSGPEDVEAMIQMAKAAGITPVVMTPTFAEFNTENGEVTRAYAETVRGYASTYSVPLCDTWQAIMDWKNSSSTPYLEYQLHYKATIDGVHMAPAGDRVMARTLLRALGLDDGQMANAEAAWNSNEKIYAVHPAVKITSAQLATFKQAAANAGMGGGEFSKVVFRRGLASLAANPTVEQGAYGSNVETFSAGFSINMADYDTLLSTSLAPAYVPADNKKGHLDATIGMAMLRGIRECEAGEPVVVVPQDVQTNLFSRCVSFTASGYAGESALADFPVAVRLAANSPTGFSYADMADPSGGGELRFADADGKSLDFDVEEWNTEGLSLVWVKVPVLTKTTTFTMYYGGTPTDEVKSIRAWSADYVGVWHMSEADGDVADSAGNGLTASPNGSGASYSVAGQGVFGKARVNTSVRNKGTGRSMLVVSDSYLLDLGSDFTMSGWVKMTDTIDGGGLARIAVRSADGATPEWEVALADATTLQASGNGGETLSGQIPSAMNSWRHVAAVYDGASLKVYVDGTVVLDGAITAAKDSNNKLCFGTKGGLYNGHFTGLFDEFRLRDAACSADWVKAEYDQADGSFLSNEGVKSLDGGYGSGTPAAGGKVVEFTCSGYEGGSTLVGFPVLVRLANGSPAGFRYSDMLSSATCAELRFSDASGAALPFEVESWNPTGESLVWVGVPEVRKGTVFTMSYGGEPEGPTPLSSGVWTPYVGVWHMDESDGAVADATGHGLEATPNVAQTSGPGVIGAARVNATSAAGSVVSYLSVPSYDSFFVGDSFAVSGWVKATADSTGCRLFARTANWFDTSGFACAIDGFEKVSVCGKAYNTTVVADTPSIDGQWVHLAVSYAGTTATVYANGVQVASGTIEKVEDNNKPLTIGSLSGVGGTPLKGLLDEFRLKLDAASADWVKAEYDQAAGQFLSAEVYDVLDPEARVVLTVPALEHMSVSAVKVNGVVVPAEADGTYLVRPRETVTVEFSPSDGYVLSSSAMVFKAREDMSLPEDGRPIAMPFDSVHVAINELCASNDDESGFETANGGRGIDWVELYNGGDVAVDLSGWYLFDNPAKAKSKWTKICGSCIVPAHGYAVVWCDKDYGVWEQSEAHASIGLSTAGEPLFLARPDGVKVCEIANFGKQVKGISWGRAGGGEATGYFLEPTPGAENASEVKGAPTPSVAFGEPHGYKDCAFDLTMSCPDDPFAEIRYTLDGSSPTSASAKFTGPIRIDSTTVVRAAVPQENSVLQCDSSASYLFLSDILQQAEGNRPEGFPASSSQQTMLYGMSSAVVNGPDRSRLLNGFTNSIRTVSLVVDPELMFGAATGIYVNASQDGWERPTMVEQINPADAADEFTVPCGIRIRGAGSRRSVVPKHAFHLVFRSRYGLSKLEHPLFGDEGAGSFDRIDFRVANTSWANSVDKESDKDKFTYIEEVFSRDTQRDMGQPYHRSRYYNLFINGVYWGIYQTEERMSASYAATYCGGQESDYDVVRTSYPSYSTQTVDGEDASWAGLYAISSEGFSGDHADNYNRVRGLDPDGSRNLDYPVYLNATNLIDYMLVAHWTADCDTPAAPDKVNNIAAFRNRVDGAGLYDGFIWNRHDTEATLGNYLGFGDVNKADSLTFGTSASPYGTPWNTLAKFGAAELNYKLLQNEEYRMTFADLAYRHILRPDGALSVDAATARYRARMAELDDAIVCEAARWGGGRTREGWLAACERHLSFIANRTPYLIGGYRSLGWYPSVDAPTVAASGGRRLLGGEQVDGPVTVSSDSSGTVYYTTDGSDPRLAGGGVSPAAKVCDAAIEVPYSGFVLSARLRSAAGEWSALERVELRGGGAVPPEALYTGEYSESVAIIEPGEYFFSNANFRAGLVLGEGTYFLNNCRDTSNTASGIVAAGSVVFGQQGTMTLAGTGADPLMSVCDLIVSNGTFKVEYANETPKAMAVNVMGSFAVECEGTVEVTVGGRQNYGIYIANKDMFCRVGAGGTFAATVGGTKSAALYGNKGSVDAEVENDSCVRATLAGPEARLFNFAGKIKLKGGNIDVTGEESAVSNKVFKSDKSIAVKRGARITVNACGEGSEAFSCATVFEMEGGHVEVVTADDCVGAEAGVLVTGGKFYGRSLHNDVFDSNAGDITIDGGLVLAYTTAQEQTDDPARTVGSFGFDVNGYRVVVNGGTVVAIGGDNLDGDHFPAFAGTQNLFVDRDAAASKYDGRYVSFLVDGTNTTVGLPAITSERCTVICTAPGLPQGSQPAILQSAPETGSIGFHEVYVNVGDTFAPGAASVSIEGSEVKIGVSSLQAECWYAIEKTTDLTQPFEIDVSTWTKGAALLAGERTLSIAIDGGEPQAFYRVVMSVTAP